MPKEIRVGDVVRNKESKLEAVVRYIERPNPSGQQLTAELLIAHGGKTVTWEAQDCEIVSQTRFTNCRYECIGMCSRNFIAKQCKYCLAMRHRCEHYKEVDDA